MSASHHFSGVGDMAEDHDNGIQSTKGDIDGSIQLFYSIKGSIQNPKISAVIEHMLS